MLGFLYSVVLYNLNLRINKDVNLKIIKGILPYAEGVNEIWKNGNLQVKESEIEIIVWDSDCTIVNFTDESLSTKFKDYFDEAIELEKYNWKNKAYNRRLP